MQEIVGKKYFWYMTPFGQEDKVASCTHREVTGGSGGMAPFINIDARLRLVVGFTPRPLYPRARNPGSH
jgi:hypothetical protein